MGRFRALAVGLALLVASAWSIAGVPGLAGAPGLACAAEGGPRAALVVDTGSTVVRHCVALDGQNVSGTHLIELAASQHGLAYALGFGGQAVCMLAGVGPTGGDCWAEYPDYWGYWHGDGAGGWAWASGSAASFRVEDGDVEGWVWGPGDTPSTHAQPPRTRFGDVCAPVTPAPAPSSAPSPKPSQGPADNGSDPVDTSQGSPDAGTPGAGVEPDDRERERDDRPPGERTPTPTDPSTPVTLAGDDLRATGTTVPDGGGGPPGGLVVALVAGLGLAGAGWRRRRTRNHAGAG